MTDERMKQLMEQAGFHQSHSIAQLILQVENETAQECRKVALEMYRSDDYAASVAGAIAIRIKVKFGLEI